MNNPYIQIYNHFGRDAQIEKLREEVEEFIEAVMSGDKEHMHEELADVFVCLNQFTTANDLDANKSIEYMEVKIKRTMERMESGYYEKK